MNNLQIAPKLSGIHPQALEQTLPWKKVIGLALLLSIVGFISFTIWTSTLISIIGLNLVILGPFIYLIYVLPVIVLLYFAGKYLHKLGLKNPYFHIIFAGAISLAMWMLSKKIVGLLLTEPIAISNPILAILLMNAIDYIFMHIGFAVGLLASVRWIESRPAIGSWLVSKKLALSLVLALLLIGVYLVPNASQHRLQQGFQNINNQYKQREDERKANEERRVEALNDALKSWLSAPTYVIPGTTGNENCNKLDYTENRITCTIKINQLPAFLSESTLSKLPNTFNDSLVKKTPYPLLTVRIGKDDAVLDKYKLHEEQCDVQNIRLNLYIDRERAYKGDLNQESSPKKCVSLMTPGGIMLIYESYKNYENSYLKDAAQVPSHMYFEKNGTIAILDTAPELDYVRSDTVNSLILASPEAMAEILKFVDGFQRITQ